MKTLRQIFTVVLRVALALGLILPTHHASAATTTIYLEPGGRWMRHHQDAMQDAAGNSKRADYEPTCAAGANGYQYYRWYKITYADECDGNKIKTYNDTPKKDTSGNLLSPFWEDDYLPKPYCGGCDGDTGTVDDWYGEWDAWGWHHATDISKLVDPNDPTDPNNYKRAWLYLPFDPGGSHNDQVQLNRNWLYIPKGKYVTSVKLEDFSDEEMMVWVNGVNIWSAISSTSDWYHLKTHYFTSFVNQQFVGGQNNLIAISLWNNGNGAGIQYRFTIDTQDDNTPPTVMSIMPGGYYPSGTTFSTQANDAGGSGLYSALISQDQVNWLPSIQVNTTTHLWGKATDRAGNVTNMDYGVVRIDATAPTINTPTVNGLTFSVSAIDNESGMRTTTCYAVSSTGIRTDGASSASSCAVSVGTADNYTLTVTATDNVSLSTTTPFTLFGENQPPYSPSTPAIESNGVMDNTPTKILAPSFLWTPPNDPGGSGVQDYQVAWQTDSVTPASGYSPTGTSPSYTPTAFTTSSQSGTYYLFVRARDKANNVSGWTPMFKYIYDVTPPGGVGIIQEVKNHTSSGGETTDNEFKFQWTTPTPAENNPEYGVWYKIYFDTKFYSYNQSAGVETCFAPTMTGSNPDQPVATLQDDPNNSASRSYSDSVIRNGKYCLWVYPVDKVNNVGPGSYFIYNYTGGLKPSPVITGIALQGVSSPHLIAYSNAPLTPGWTILYGSNVTGTLHIDAQTGDVIDQDISTQATGIIFPAILGQPTPVTVPVEKTWKVSAASYNYSNANLLDATYNNSTYEVNVATTITPRPVPITFIQDTTPPGIFPIAFTGDDGLFSASGSTVTVGTGTNGTTLTVSATVKHPHTDQNNHMQVQSVTCPASFGRTAEFAATKAGDTYSCAYTVASLTAGDFWITATDSLGNQSTSKFTVIVDATAPVVDNLTVPDYPGQTFFITWAGHDDGGAGLARFELGRTSASDCTGITTVKKVSADTSKVELVNNNTGICIRAVDRVGLEGAWKYNKSSGFSVNETLYYAMDGISAVERRDSGGTNSAITYSIADHIGSVGLTVKPDGDIVSNVRYLPFGQERTNTPVGMTDLNMPTDHGYTGQRNETGFGLMDYNARFYSPALGRFVSPDTVIPDSKDARSYDRYAYSNNNPINYNDPSGHCAIGTSTISPLGIFTLYASCVQDVVDAVHAYQSGERRPGVLYMEATGIKDALVSVADGVHQLNTDMTNTFYPKDPNSLEHYISSARLGLTAVNTGNLVAGGVALGRAANAQLTTMIDQELSWGESLGYGYDAANIPQVTYNKLAGDGFRDEMAALFKQNGYGVEMEVPKETPFGRRVIDIEVTSPQGTILGGIETKTGRSRYTAAQRAKDEYLRIVEQYIVNVIRRK